MTLPYLNPVNFCLPDLKYRLNFEHSLRVAYNRSAADNMMDDIFFADRAEISMGVKRYIYRFDGIKAYIFIIRQQSRMALRAFYEILIFCFTFGLVDNLHFTEKK